MIIAETPKLTLRWLESSDAAFILRLLNEPAWIQYIGDRGLRTLADARAYIETGPRSMYVEQGFGLFLVELNDGLEPIGICGLIKRDTLDDVDIGFAFLEEYWGNGYAGDSAELTLHYARTTHHLTRIVAITDPNNTASITLLTKLGFSFEQTLGVGNDQTNLYGLALQSP